MSLENSRVQFETHHPREAAWCCGESKGFGGRRTDPNCGPLNKLLHLWNLSFFTNKVRKVMDPPAWHRRVVIVDQSLSAWQLIIATFFFYCGKIYRKVTILIVFKYTTQWQSLQHFKHFLIHVPPTPGALQSPSSSSLELVKLSDLQSP